MTYSSAETSQAGGAPYELFKFVRNTTQWLYTTRETTVNYLSLDYTSAVISRAPIIQHNEDASFSVEVILTRDDPLVTQFISGGASQPVLLTIFRNHTGEVAGETKTIFLGEVSSIEYSNSEVRLLCTSIDAAFTNPVARFAVQINCANMLYDAHCGVSQAANSYTGTVSAVSTSGVDITLAGVPNLGTADSFYANGFLIFAGQYRFINKQATSVMSLLASFNPSPTTGAVIVAVAGCDRSAAVCNSRFSNILRFGGFPGMPQRDPWKRII